MTNFLGRKATLKTDRAGIIGVIALAFVVAILYTPLVAYPYPEPVFEPPYLAIILQFIFVLGTGLAVVVVSSKSYLTSGSINILLISASILMSSLASIVSVWTLSPYVAPTLTANEAVTIGNIGLFLSSFGLFLSAVFTWVRIRRSVISHRRMFLVLALFVSVLLVGIISIASDFDLLPVFLTGSGPSVLSAVMLALSAIFFFASSLLLAWRYERLKSRTIFWFSLALALYGISLVAGVLTMHIGSAMDWASRVGLYLAGIYLLIAVLSPETKRTEEGVSSKWIDAFSADRKQFSVLFKNLLNAFAYCKILTDKQGNAVDWIYLDVNEAYAKISGIPKEKVIEMKATEVFPDEVNDPADWIGKYGQVALTGQSIQFEAYRKAFGKWLSVSVYSPQRGYFVSIFEDVTDRINLQYKLQEYSKNLERLVEERTKQLKDSERLAAIGATAGMVGHDIRNPLQAITGDLYLIQEDLKTVPECQNHGDIFESIQAISENISYINKIVADLQDYARPVTIQIKQISVDSILDNVLFKGAIPENVKVYRKIEGAAAVLDSDPDAIKRILANLVNNAVQAMPKGGNLTVSAYLAGNSWFLTVEDSGSGIPKEVESKLFTPLFTTKSKGQGFGLAVVKRLTEALGGNVTFESEEGKGTKFIIELPR